MEELIQITAPFFCAGAVLQDGVCREAPAIIRYMVGHDRHWIDLPCWVNPFLWMPRPGNIEEWSRRAEESNPNILIAKNNIEIAKSNIDLQTAGHLPTLD